VIGGPQSEYVPPAVDAIKKYVEQGGRAMILLDAPLKFGRPTADNTALTDLLQSWGVSMDKDLLLDMSPVGQLMGLGPEIALVSTYDTHPIVDEMKGTATGFPLSRLIDRQEHRQDHRPKAIRVVSHKSCNHEARFAECESK